MEPEFELSDVEPESSRSTVAKLLTILAICVGVSVAVAGLGAFAWNVFVFPTSDRGTCLAVDPTSCISLSEATIEDVGALSLPRGAEVFDSGSETGPQLGRAWAVVQLPDGGELTLGDGYRAADVVTEMPTFGSGKSFLEEQGFTSLEAVSVDDAGTRGYRKVYLGTNATGDRVAYILKWQDSPGGLFSAQPAPTE